MSLQDIYGNRSFILETLLEYKKNIVNNCYFRLADELQEKSSTVDDIIAFIKDNNNCFYRECAMGHITSSALVTNHNFTKVLFTYHAKLKKWLQLGGHCDGEHLVHLSALREAQEESGLNSISFLNIFNFPKCIGENHFPHPFDIDIHYIPARGNEPGHFHYDIRYLLSAQAEEGIIISDESLDLKWISVEEISSYSNELSCIRQIEKLKHLVTKYMRL